VSVFAGCNLMLACLFALALVIPAMTQPAPPLEGGSWSTAGEAAWAGAHNVPSWTPAIARQFPGCEKAAAAYGSRVVVKLDGKAYRMSWDESWERTHNENKADDVWVVGSCPS
jgi:hypothetical protein